MNVSIVTVEKKEIEVACDKWEIREGFLLMYVGKKTSGIGVSQIKMFEADEPSCSAPKEPDKK